MNKWVELVTAPNETTAEMLREILLKNGIEAIVKKDAPSFLGVSFIPCRVLIPEDKTSEARKILRNLEAENDLSAQGD